MKLDGVRVLDLSMFLPGPHLTMTMADHGAEVIRVEPPGGEPSRAFPHRMAGHAVWFRNTHRGKRSIVIDLKRELGRDVLLRLVERADVLVEGFRPGVMDRLGVGPDRCLARNPRLIWCSISAFGQNGPLAQAPAHDLAVQARAGIVSLNLGEDGVPTNPSMPAADMAASLTALSAILMALFARERTGRGEVIDVAMLDSALAWLPNVTGRVFAEGRAPEVKQERAFGGGSFYRVYATRDGRHLVLGGSEAKFVRALLEALGRPDLIPAGTTWPGPSHEPVKAFLRDTFATRTLAEWMEFLAGLDVCAAPVNDLVEAFAEPQVDARAMLVREADGTPHLGLPIKFRDEPGRIDPRVPELGADTAAILAEAGYAQGEIEALTASGAVIVPAARASGSAFDPSTSDGAA